MVSPSYTPSVGAASLARTTIGYNMSHLLLAIFSLKVVWMGLTELEPYYHKFADQYNRTELAVFIACVPATFFFTFGGLLSIPIVIEMPGKLQPSKFSPVFQGFGLVVFNYLLGLLVMSALFWFLLPDESYWGQLPDFWHAARDYIIFVCIEEPLFFYQHWFAHSNSWVYRNIHKLHHTFTAPSAFHVVYTHPVEHLMVNILPLAIGPMVMKSHIVLAVVWIILGTSTSLVAHCGYVIPTIPTNPMHDLHHERFLGNYGVLGILDWLHGTYRAKDSIATPHIVTEKEKEM